MDDSLGVHGLYGVDELEEDGTGPCLSEPRLSPQSLQQLPSSQHLHHQVHMQLEIDRESVTHTFLHNRGSHA